MAGKMITSTELAALCGVSQGTVDRALHDRPGIAAATKQRILRKAAEQGYLLHPGARELATGTSTVVGAVIPALHTPFFWNLLLALKEAFAAAGAPFHAAPVADTDEFTAAVSEFAARRVQGVVMIPPSDGIRLPEAVSTAVNGVTLFTPLADSTAAFISPDEEAAGRQAVEYLLSQDRQRIVHLTLAKAIPPATGRASGYTAAMRQAGLKPEIITDAGPAAIRKIVTADPRTAFFCFNDWLALQVTRAMEQTVFSFKTDVAVMGVDADPTFTELIPEITSMAYPFAAVAEAVKAYITSGTQPDRAALRYSFRQGQTA